MSEVDFADRYAQAYIQPTADFLAARKASVARIQKNINGGRILELVATYYGMKPDLTWFRDALREDDPTFSFVANERETILVAALVLAGKIEEVESTSILGVVAGSVRGRRVPTDAAWLLVEAQSALAENAGRARVPQDLAMPIRAGTTPKLSEDLTAATSLEALVQVVPKIRNESQESERHIAKQVSDALRTLEENARYQREESQILWWLFGEHSRSLGKAFSAFRPAQAALIGGLELGALTTASELGPVAAQAVLERVLRGAKKENKPQPITLLSAIDGLVADLAKLEAPEPARPEICPVLTAIAKAKEIGISAWADSFQKATGLEASMAFEPVDLALQAYHECLLEYVE